MTIDLTQQSYNKFEGLENIPYNCINYMMNNNELIWKLLKYSDPDAWKKADLTTSEKGLLVYDGLKDPTSCRVFMDVGLDDSWLVEACMLRVSVVEAVPTNYVRGNITVGFEIYSHYKINHLSNYTTRLDKLAQQVIEVFNGADIADVGRLYFDARAHRTAKLSTIGMIPYKGKAVVMCNHSLG
jgi:hypothetical protein